MHGHQAGDEALAEVARAIEAEARASDHACRIGGEEFALLLPGADAGSALLVAERIRRRVQEIRAVAPITVSLGVAASDGHDERAALFARADERLYAAKATGRNRAVGVSPAR